MDTEEHALWNKQRAVAALVEKLWSVDPEDARLGNEYVADGLRAHSPKLSNFHHLVVPLQSPHSEAPA